MDVLPGVPFYPGPNGRTLSGNGQVVIGYKTSSQESYYFRWTPAGTTTRLPSGPGGYAWSPPASLSNDGNTIVGTGEHAGTTSIIWKSGLGTYTVTDGKTSMYSGVAPDASYAVRIDFSSKRETAYRDYPDFSFTKWATVSGDNSHLEGVTEDASRLFGTANDSYFNKVLPCYWDSAGEITFCAAIADQLNPVPSFASKTGQYISGTVDTGQYIQDYGNATTTFVWNTVTNQVVYYTPLSLMFNYPTFISPAGQVLAISGYITPYEYTTYIFDHSSSSQASLGYQNVTDWLISHQYISHSDLTGRTHFSVTGMSDDEQAIVGTFQKNDQTYVFYAHRLVAIAEPRPTAKLFP